MVEGGDGKVLSIRLYVRNGYRVSWSAFETVSRMQIHACLTQDVSFQTADDTCAHAVMIPRSVCSPLAGTGKTPPEKGIAPNPAAAMKV